jgi:putative transcriptional regulator
VYAELRQGLATPPACMCIDSSSSISPLADTVGVTIVNLSVLKNNRAKAIRYSTLVAICHALDCQPRDLFSVLPR